MPFKRFSRRQFGKSTGWSALGMPTLSAGSGRGPIGRPGSGPRNRTASSGFPNGFLGTATSAYQIEGAVSEDGRSLIDLGPLRSTRLEPYPINSNGDTATDHYRLYKEDIQLMTGARRKGLSILGIVWPRVFPEGAGAPNQRASISTTALSTKVVGERHHAVCDPAITGTCRRHCRIASAVLTSRDTSKAFADYAAHVTAKRLSVYRVKTLLHHQRMLQARSSRP